MHTISKCSFCGPFISFRVYVGWNGLEFSTNSQQRDDGMMYIVRQIHQYTNDALCIIRALNLCKIQRFHSFIPCIVYICACSMICHAEGVLYFIVRTSNMPVAWCVSSGGLLLLTRGTIALFSPSSHGFTAWAYRKSLPCGLDSIVYKTFQRTNTHHT